MAAAGNQRALGALAETIEAFSPVDLGTPPTVPSSAAEERFVEGEEIGRGGLGVVLEAFDQDLRRTAALKRPRDDRSAAAAGRSLVREAQVTAQLEHPNIPSVYSVGVDGSGRPFFTMTRLYGSSLAELLAARTTDREVAEQLTVPRLLRIFLQVAYAVAFAHDRGVIHRDLKSANVVIGAFGEVRLVDWGIAKICDLPECAGLDEERPARCETTVEDDETAAGDFLGTPGFAAPEQAMGETDLDGRADVYALGALLYEMLSGRAPVTGDSAQQVLLKTVAGELEPIQRLVPVSDRLAAIVHKALATERDHRYGGVLDMVADVEALLEGRPVSAHAEGALTRVRKWYFGRSPRVARIRNVDLDLALWSSFAFGMATGSLILWIPSDWHDPLAWVTLATAVLAAIVPIHTILRRPRPDDPGALLPFRDGLLSGRPASSARSGRGYGGVSSPADADAKTEVATPKPRER